MSDLNSLTDSQIRARLKAHGFNPGPVTDTTRQIYLNRLNSLEAGEKNSHKNYSNSPKNNKLNISVGNEKQVSSSPRKSYVAPKQFFSRFSYTPYQERENFDDFKTSYTSPKEREDLKTESPEKTPKNTESLNKTFTKSPLFNESIKSTSSVGSVPPPRNKPFFSTIASPIYKPQTNRKFKISIMKSSLLIYLLYIIMIPIFLAFVYPFLFKIFFLAKNHIKLIFIFLCSLIFLTLIFYFINLIYKRRKLRILKHTKEKYEYIDKILDLLKRRLSDYQKKRVDSPYIPILHIRDILFSPSERRSKSSLWNDVSEFLCKNESRVRTELQNIGGKDCQVWKWIGTPLEIDTQTSFNDKITSESSIYNSISNCLKIFIDCDESEFKNLSASFLTMLETFGFKVIDSQLNVLKLAIYVKLENKEKAVEFFNRFNRSKFHGHFLKVKFIKQSTTNKRF